MTTYLKPYQSASDLAIILHTETLSEDRLAKIESHPNADATVVALVAYQRAQVASKPSRRDGTKNFKLLTPPSCGTCKHRQKVAAMPGELAVDAATFGVWACDVFVTYEAERTVYLMSGDPHTGMCELWESDAA